jgi:phage shock protein A
MLAEQKEQQSSAVAIEQATSSIREQLSNIEKERDELKVKVEQTETGIQSVKDQELILRQKLQEVGSCYLNVKQF